MRSWNWNPGVSVGELFFGAPLHPEELDPHLEALPHDGSEWDAYRFADRSATVSVEDGKIVSIECYRSLKLDDHELIGLPVRELNRLLPRATILCETCEDGTERWDCDELGLMAWVEDGVVASVTVSAPSDD